MVTGAHVVFGAHVRQRSKRRCGPQVVFGAQVVMGALVVTGAHVVFGAQVVAGAHVVCGVQVVAANAATPSLPVADADWSLYSSETRPNMATMVNTNVNLFIANSTSLQLDSCGETRK